MNARKNWTADWWTNEINFPVYNSENSPVDFVSSLFFIVFTSISSVLALVSQNDKGNKRWVNGWKEREVGGKRKAKTIIL